MKTTVEIKDALLEEGRSVAAREGMTLRDLIEEGLRRAIAERKSKKRFRLRRATFKGRGLQEGIAEGDWETIRALIYEGRGA